MNRKTTKRSLMMSVLSLFLCFAMLLGTTFAWFTDSVSSANNIITSGNLDVELYYQVEGSDEWIEVDENTNVFKKNALWEPGHTEVVKLKVVNAGTLALKYQLGINVASETTGINVANEPFKLSDYIMFGVADGAKDFANRDAAIAGVTATKLNVAYSKSSTLLAAEGKNESAEIVTMVVYMPTTVGNEANAKKGTAAPTINLGINLFATQYSSEMDSFDEYYDGGAEWTGGIDISWYDPDATELTVSTAEQLAGLAAIVNGTAAANVSTFAAESTAVSIHDDFKGKIVKLGSNIELGGKAWTPIGRIGASSTDFTYAFKGTFDGQNYVIEDLKVSNDGWAGLFGLAHSATIKNVKVVDAIIDSNRMAGTIVGQLYGSLDNCHAEGISIVVKPNAVGSSFDNGDKVGGIVGWIGDNGNNRTLTNCSVTDASIGAYRDFAGIAGYVASSTIVSGNKVEDVDLTGDQIENYYGDKDFNAGAIYGRTGGAIVDSGDNTSVEVSITNKYVKDGIEYRNDGEGEVKLYLVPEEYTGSTVTIPEGVTTIGGYAFAYNTNVKTIILPSTVTTIADRAFRDTSASKVVLNEGLTNISYQAFRNATNVKSVVIPSTVTTISKEAFQSSGITSLTIPATVKTIEYGGCRDMKMLETVVIEGDVEIPVYAFRACTNLKAVYLTGDNVTFAGRGMIFTNKENGDGSAITIYVANETVKAGLIANDTAAKDYGGYDIVIMTTPEAGEDFKDNFTSGADTIYVPAGEYASFPTSSLSAGDTLICAPGTVFKGEASLNAKGATIIGATFSNPSGNAAGSQTTVNGTFKNCVFTGKNALRYGYAGDTVVFEDCEFIATSVYSIHFDGTTGKDLLFKNCKIVGWVAITGGHKSLTFDGCEIYGNGTYGVIRTYGDATIKNCTFDVDNVNTTDVYQDGIHAVDCTITVENCTNVNGSIYDTVNVSGTGIVKVDGDIVVSSATQLQTVLDNATGETGIVFKNNITGNVTVTQKPGVAITIDGNGKTLNGTITVDGKSAAYATASVTIKNVKFVADTVATEACINLGVKGNTNTRYINNLTVEDCYFNVPGKVAIKSYDNGDKNFTIKGCTVAAGMHSLLQVNNVADGILVENCTVNSKNGVNVNQSTVVTVKGSTFNVLGYAVRFGATSGDLTTLKTFVIEDCSLTSACEEADDAVVIVRASCGNATLAINNTTLKGDVTLTNASDANVIIDGVKVKVVYSADSLVSAFANLNAGDVLYIANSIDMTGKTVSPVTGNKGFTMLGNGYTISNLHSTERALFVAHSGSAAYTFDGVVLENCSVDSATDYAALFVGDGDTSDAITITNCHVKNCTVKSAKYAAAFVAYTAGYDVQNNGPVYSDVLIKNCSMIGGSITGGGSVGVAIAHSGGNVDTTSTVTELTVKDVVITGEDAAHTGIAVGTAHIGETIINGISYSGVTGNYNTTTVLYGRFVPGTTGTLTINGTAV